MTRGQSPPTGARRRSNILPARRFPFRPSTDGGSLDRRGRKERSMTRRGGAIALASSLVVLCICAGLVGWRLTRHRPTIQSPPESAQQNKPEAVATKPQPAVKISTITDLPADPV